MMNQKQSPQLCGSRPPYQLPFPQINIRFSQMGGQQSKKRDQIVQIIKQHTQDKKGSPLSEKEFSEALFRSLDLAPKHTTYGPLLLSGSHVLRRLYAYLRSQVPPPITKTKIIEVVQKCFDDPAIAIEYSYKIIQPIQDSNITKTQFVEFITLCFSRGVAAIMNEHRADQKFKKRFADWVSSNNFKIAQAAQLTFNKQALSERDEWTRGDFKRWILSDSQWVIQAEIKDTVYRIPLNLPCLFGIILEPQKKK